MGDPVLYFHARRRQLVSPGVRLVAAILEDACMCLSPRALVGARTRADAVAWVKGEVRSAPFCSFREVCSIMGLDEAQARRRLLRAGPDEEPPARLVA